MHGLGDVERARQFYEDGEGHFRAGRYLQAASAFVSAHNEEPTHPNPLWSAASSYERAGRRDSAIQYYDQHSVVVARFTGTPRPAHTAAQSRAAAERLRQQIAQERPEDEGVIEEVWSWITGGQDEAPAPGQPSGRDETTAGKGVIGQTVDKIAGAFGIGAAKTATDTARQTAALEEEVQSGAEAPVVTMPTGGSVSLPGWFPYAIMGVIGVAGVAGVAWYMRHKPEEK